MNNFMPRLRSVMSTHQLKVIYAQDRPDTRALVCVAPAEVSRC